MKEKKKKITFKEKMHYLKILFKYAKEDKIYLIIFVIGNILLSAISIIVPILSAKKIVYLTTSIWKQLIIVVFYIFIFEISRNLVRFICQYTSNKLNYKIIKKIKHELIKETLKITNDEINKNSSGVFIERINNDTNDITNVFAQVIDYLTDIMTSIGVYISIFFISKELFIIYGITAICRTLLASYMQKKIYEKNKIVRKNNEKISGFSSEIIRGSKDIKILNAENSFLNKTDELLDESYDIKLDFLKTWSGLGFLRSDVTDLFAYITDIIAVIVVMNGKLSVASLLIIFNYSQKILNISNYFNGLLETLRKYELARERIFGILENKEFEKEKYGTKKIKHYKGNIKFDHVKFGYEDDLIIKDMSFEIPANKTIAFVGKSGAGKSTIYNLISKLYDVNDGNIYFDNEEIRTLDKDSIRGNLSIISQSPYIFNLSIKENLEIIKNDATFEDIKRVCKMACLDDFIESLPNKYDTIVGEGGVTLSGGQRQRLAIARALLQNTKLILFDEATSALDNETQEEIQKAINNLKGEYTVLIIAHRLTTVKDADCIYVVDDGKIVGSGTIKELLKSCKVFKKLYDSELQ